MRRVFLSAIILLVGAVILSPVIAAFGFDPVPGDLAFRWGNTPVTIPVTYSLCASLGLALFWRIMKR